MSLSWADRLARLAQQIDNAGVIDSGALPPSQGGQVTSNAGPTTCLEGSYLEYALT